MFRFFATENFVKSLEQLDPRFQKSVKEKLRFLQETENPLFFARKLKGQKNIFRFRAGDYRMIFRLDDTALVLLFVKHRREVYEGL